jgi:hypothetical protein
MMQLRSEELLVGRQKDHAWSYHMVLGFSDTLGDGKWQRHQALSFAVLEAPAGVTRRQGKKQ